MKNFLETQRPLNSPRTIIIGPSFVSKLKDEYNLGFCRTDGDVLPKLTLFHAISHTLKKAGLPHLPIAPHTCGYAA